MRTPLSGGLHRERGERGEGKKKRRIRGGTITSNLICSAPLRLGKKKSKRGKGPSLPRYSYGLRMRLWEKRERGEEKIVKRGDLSS